MKYYVSVAGREYEVELETASGRQTVRIDGETMNLDSWMVDGNVVHLLCEQSNHEIGLESTGNEWQLTTRWGRYSATVETEQEKRLRTVGRIARHQTGQSIRAQMPGKIVALEVAAGQKVNKGDVILVLEAMKMENEIRSETEGTVKEVKVEVGMTVEAGALLVEIAS